MDDACAFFGANRRRSVAYFAFALFFLLFLPSFAFAAKSFDDVIADGRITLGEVIDGDSLDIPLKWCGVDPLYSKRQCLYESRVVFEIPCSEQKERVVRDGTVYSVNQILVNGSLSATLTNFGIGGNGDWRDFLSPLGKTAYGREVSVSIKAENKSFERSMGEDRQFYCGLNRVFISVRDLYEPGQDASAPKKIRLLESAPLLVIAPRLNVSVSFSPLAANASALGAVHFDVTTSLAGITPTGMQSAKDVRMVISALLFDEDGAKGGLFKNLDLFDGKVNLSPGQTKVWRLAVKGPISRGEVKKIKLNVSFAVFWEDLYVNGIRTNNLSHRYEWSAPIFKVGGFEPPLALLGNASSGAAAPDFFSGLACSLLGWCGCKCKRGDACLSSAKCCSDGQCASGLCDLGSNVCVRKEICVELVKNGDGGVKADVVIIGDGYGGYAELKSDAEKVLDYKGDNGFYGLFSTNVFKRNKGKINAWILLPESDIARDKNDSKRPDFSASRNLAESKCSGADFVVVLSKKSFRSVAWGKTALVSVGSEVDGCGHLFDWATLECDARTFTHEFGHVFAGLADEYVEEGNGDKSREPNCAPDNKTAGEWWGDVANFTKIGFYSGCSYVEKNVRPTRNSVMRIHWFNEDDFYKVNERKIESILSKYE